MYLHCFSFISLEAHLNKLYLQSKMQNSQPSKYIEHMTTGLQSYGHVLIMTMRVTVLYINHCMCQILILNASSMIAFELDYIIIVLLCRFRSICFVYLSITSTRLHNVSSCVSYRLHNSNGYNSYRLHIGCVYTDCCLCGFKHSMDVSVAVYRSL